MNFENPPAKRQQVEEKVVRVEAEPTTNQVPTNFNINRHQKNNGLGNKNEEGHISQLINQKVNKIIAEKLEFELNENSLSDGKNTEKSFSLNSNLSSEFPAELQTIVNDPSTVLKNSGSLPNISLAWYLIGDSLHLWNYKLDVYYKIEVGAENVSTVGFVRATPGVFGPGIEYLLLLGFEHSVKVFGASLTLLKSTDQFCYSNLQYTVYSGFKPSYILSTNSDRVFIGGNCGSISEFVCRKYNYFGFSRFYLTKCNESYISYFTQFLNGSSDDKMIISMSADEQRHVLYTLSKNSEIKVYDLGLNPNELRYLGAVTDPRPKASKAFNLAENAVISLTSIHSIPKADSDELRLVAVTNSGASIFFSSDSSNLMSNATGLKFFTTRPSRGKVEMTPSSIDPISHYNNGVLIIATPCNGTEYDLAFNYLEKTPIRNTTQTSEAYHVTKIPGPVYGIYESPPNPLKTYGSEVIAPNIASFGYLKAQYYSPSRKFNILTPNGLQVFLKKRPVDQLLDILSCGPDSYKLQVFCRRFGVEETCSMCLSLLVKYPLSLLELFPEVDIFSTTKYVAFDQSIQAEAVRTLQKYGGFPYFSSTTRLVVTSQVQGQSSPNNSLTNSILFAGSIAFISHVLAPVWTTRIMYIKDNTDLNLPPSYAMAIPIETLNFLISVLRSIIEKLKEQPTFLQLYPEDVIPVQLNNPFVANALNPVFNELDKARDGELKHFEDLKATLEIAYQCSHFLCVLNKYGIDQSVSEIPQDLLEKLRDVPFSKLLEDGYRHEIVVTLIFAVASKSNPETCYSLKNDLSEVCADFCRQDIFHIIEGNEHLNMVEENLVPSERVELLRQSLSSFENISLPLPLSQLRLIVEKFCYFGFESGALNLIVKNLDLTHNLLNRANPADFELRYLSQNQITTKSCDGICTLVQIPLQSALTSFQLYPRAELSEDVKPVIKNIFDSIVSTTDIKYHDALCDWLIDHKVEHFLLEFKFPPVENYLRRRIASAETFADFEKWSIFLGKYYLKSGSIFGYARVYQELATTAKFSVKVSKRYEYLQAAKTQLDMFAKPLRDLTDKPFTDLEEQKFYEELIVTFHRAWVQDSIYNELVAFGCVTSSFHQVLPRLHSKLFTFSELYQDFIKPENLYASQLFFLQVLCYFKLGDQGIQEISNRPDIDEMVQKIWARIFDLSYDVGSSTLPNLERSLQRIEKRIELFATRAKFYDYFFQPGCVVNVCFQKAAQFYYVNNYDAAITLLRNWPGKILLLSGFEVDTAISKVFSLIRTTEDLKWFTPLNFCIVLHALFTLFQNPGACEKIDSLLLRNYFYKIKTFCGDLRFTHANYSHSLYVLGQLEKLLDKAFNDREKLGAYLFVENF